MDGWVKANWLGNLDLGMTHRHHKALGRSCFANRWRNRKKKSSVWRKKTTFWRKPALFLPQAIWSFLQSKRKTANQKAILLFSARHSMSAGRDFTSISQIKSVHGNISPWRMPWKKSWRKRNARIHMVGSACIRHWQWSNWNIWKSPVNRLPCHGGNRDQLSSQAQTERDHESGQGSQKVGRSLKTWFPRRGTTDKMFHRHSKDQRQRWEMLCFCYVWLLRFQRDRPGDGCQHESAVMRQRTWPLINSEPSSWDMSSATGISQGSAQPREGFLRWANDSNSIILNIMRHKIQNLFPIIGCAYP